MISPGQGRSATCPELRTDNLKAVAVYGDDQMNDARMALMTVRAAVDAGAVGPQPRRGHRAALHQGPGHRRRAARTGRTARSSASNARLVLNATGPWVDHLRKLEDPAAAPSIRLSKGAHLVLKRTAPVEGRAGHPDRQVPHHLRPAVGGHAAARHDRRGVRGRPGRRRGHREGHRADPGRGGVLRPGPAALPRPDHATPSRGCGCCPAAPATRRRPSARRSSPRAAAGCCRSRAASGRRSGTSAVRS